MNERTNFTMAPQHCNTLKANCFDLFPSFVVLPFAIRFSLFHRLSIPVALFSIPICFASLFVVCIVSSRKRYFEFVCSICDLYTGVSHGNQVCSSCCCVLRGLISSSNVLCFQFSEIRSINYNVLRCGLKPTRIQRNFNHIPIENEMDRFCKQFIRTICGKQSCYYFTSFPLFCFLLEISRQIASVYNSICRILTKYDREHIQSN